MSLSLVLAVNNLEGATLLRGHRFALNGFNACQWRRRVDQLLVKGGHIVGLTFHFDKNATTRIADKTG